MILTNVIQILHAYFKNYHIANEAKITFKRGLENEDI